MPHRIGFTVVFASGEDELYRASELNAHGPTVVGWQSARECAYPQELILQLHSTAIVQKIQVLAHQYLIPEKLELWAGSNMDDTDVQFSTKTAQFEYLGFITLSDNQTTGFTSRELKSVTVPSCVARYLKLRLYANHPNSLNAYKQVGLIAINVLGQYTDSPSMSSLASSKLEKPLSEQNNNGTGHEATSSHSSNNGNNNALLLVNNPKYTSPYDDLAFEMYVDQEVARIIRTMEAKKQQAVICERFEFARKLKLAMEDLRNAGEKLSKYELEKRHAIQLEDYERAKLKKAQMDEYRHTVYRFLEVDDLLEINGPLEKNDECLEISMPGAPSQHPKTSPTTSPTNLQSHGYQPPPNNLRGSQRRHKASGGTGTPARTSFEAYEERTIPALRHCHTNTHREYQLDGTPETPTRSRLTEREKKQATLPIAVYGIDLVEKFYSKQYSDKEEGLRLLKEELRALVSGDSNLYQQHNSPNKTARAAIFLLHRALRDKVYAVYSLAAEAIRLFFIEFVPTRVTPAEVARSVDRLLPELLSKSGDPTPRIHNMAVHTILSMADCREVRDLHLIPVHLSRPLTSSTHPRLALSRLEMVEQLVLNHGISTEKQSGLTCRVLSEFGSSGLHHPAEAVRKVAERILTLVYRVNPRLVRKQLPPDDDITRRNLLYRQLFHEFDRIDIQRKKEILERNKQAAVAAAAGSVGEGSGGQGSSSSSASAITSPSDTSQQDAPDDKMCIFCLSRADSFTEEGLNIHYWRSCPMLMRCTHCKQVVEIASLSQHLLEECEMRDSYRKCERCTEAVPYERFDQHKSDSSCNSAESESTANHCPLCHCNIPPYEDGWRHHLIGLPCPNHPRKKHLKNRSKSPSTDLKDLPAAQSTSLAHKSPY
ncbi:centrosomal protein of 104 kDa isoform X2 [Zootermopsis nevadensis]|uniref:centrosomal protein of 104 kDa isoform X2 n=1 Tax=Zootermopsis nevadensis TaxID=136037 RepID=UPI000B8E4F11|nr:centrosomal protein of 104 kDa isoform X2 [Zootermopsis nevadensis]